MPIRDCPLTLDDNFYTPILHINIINPHTGHNQKTYGIVDTGADECAVPAKYAKVLGHKLRSGERNIVTTGKGDTVAYRHTTSFEIYHPITDVLLYTLPDTPINFLPKLDEVLLGVDNFLCHFVLKIDYPNNTFSIRNPR